MKPLLACLALAAGACSPPDAPPPAAPESGAPSSGVAARGATPPPPVSAPALEEPPAPAPVDPAARRIALAEWRKAENRASCAPLALKDDRGEGGKARRATYSGGWAVAFDLPGPRNRLRSAYGFAGTGSLPTDAASPRAQRARLAAQWPLFRDLEHLPRPAFAGYGLEGAGAYPPDNPQGHGQTSLAYVRIAGQACDYNVWSRLGRSHLEYLLGQLELLGSVP